MDKHALQKMRNTAKRMEKISGSIKSNIAFTLVGVGTGDWLLNNLYKLAWPWFYLWFPAVMAFLTSLVWYRAKLYVRTYQYLLILAASWILNIAVGSVLINYLDLLKGLYPFYSNLWVLALFVDYFVILAGLIAAQTLLGTIRKRFWQNPRTAL